MTDIDLQAKLEALTLEALAELEGAKDENELRQWRKNRLENSSARQALDKMKDASEEERRKLEEAVTAAHSKLEAAFNARLAELRAKAEEAAQHINKGE